MLGRIWIARLAISIGMLLVAAACANEADFSGSVAQPNSGDATPVDPGTPAESDPQDPDNTYDPGLEPGDPGDPPDPDPQPVITTYTFPGAVVANETLTWTGELETAQQALTMQEAPPAVRTWQQIERAWVENNFTQGALGNIYDDEFVVSAAAPLDILVVMDDSTSMESEAINLSSKLDHLLTSITNTDWRVGVVTSSDPCLIGGKVIAPTDTDYRQLFSDAVQVPLDDTVVEKGFPMAIKALRGECEGVTTPWLRESSAVAVLVVSDEDNCGSHVGEGCAGEDGETAAQMVAYLQGLRPDGNARVYGLVELANECGTGAFTGTTYLSAINTTGGVAGSICAASYASTLESISANISRIVRYQFPLTAVPDPDEPGESNLAVTIDGEDVPAADMSLANNILTVMNVDPDSLRLVATYRSGTTPRYDRWTLTETAADGTLQVTVNGTSEPDVSFDPDDPLVVVFNAGPPADGATIQMRYRRDFVLPRVFSLMASDDIWGDPISLTVDGQATTNFELDVVGGMLKLDTAPADGVVISMTHRTRSGLVTSYDAHPMADQAAGIRVEDPVAGMDLNFTVVDNKLSFEPATVVDGRELVVHYNFGYPAEARALDIPADLVVGSLLVEQMLATDPLCALYGNDGPLSTDFAGGETVELVCPAEDVGEVKLEFSRVTSWTDIVTIPEDVPDDAMIEVAIDDTPVAFERDGNQINLLATPSAPGDEIAVQVTVN